MPKHIPAPQEPVEETRPSVTDDAIEGKVALFGDADLDALLAKADDPVALMQATSHFAQTARGLNTQKIMDNEYAAIEAKNPTKSQIMVNNVPIKAIEPDKK